MQTNYAKNSLLLVLGIAVVAAGIFVALNLNSQNSGEFSLALAGCSTTDSGYNLAKSGTCTDAESNYFESCVGSKLFEYSCSNNKCVGAQVSCPVGSVCSIGACIPIAACIDSDNGNNTSVAGTCTDYSGAHPDYCIDSTRVAEYVCGGYACTKGPGTPCPSGKHCINGVCTNSPCGNGIIDNGETCDGTDFGGQTCFSYGYAGGTLTCAPDCESINTNSCITVQSCNG